MMFTVSLIWTALMPWEMFFMLFDYWLKSDWGLTDGYSAQDISPSHLNVSAILGSLRPCVVPDADVPSLLEYSVRVSLPSPDHSR